MAAKGKVNLAGKDVATNIGHNFLSQALRGYAGDVFGNTLKAVNKHQHNGNLPERIGIFLNEALINQRLG